MNDERQTTTITNHNTTNHNTTTERSENMNTINYAESLVPALLVLTRLDAQAIKNPEAPADPAGRVAVERDIQTALNSLVGSMFETLMQNSVAEPAMSPAQKERALESFAGNLRALAC